LRKLSFLLVWMICGGAVCNTAAMADITFLVFPPENLTNNPALAWVGEAVALSVSEQLRIPGVETSSRADRLGFIESADLPPNASLSRASMIHISQLASASRLITGSFSGTEDNLLITLRVIDIKTMKMSGDVATSGPLLALPQMENELAWTVLMNAGLNKIFSREKYRERTRAVPNQAYAILIQSFSRGDPEEQAKLLTRAVELYPGFSEAQAGLGQYYFEQGDCARSIEHLEMAGGIREGALENQFKLGTCYLKQNDLQGAIRSFSAIGAFVHSPQVLNNLGVAYLRKGDYTLAAQNLIEARNAARSEPTILANLALVRHLQGEDAAARSILEEAARWNPSRGMLRFLLGIVLKQQGEQAGSESAMEQAKRLGYDPEKLAAEEPKSWARLFTTWSARP
jgi:Flp pilus assembly protein TadD